jgi:chromosome condensin MukBEF ATPase and DNA-binding subunit MukB
MEIELSSAELSAEMIDAIAKSAVTNDGISTCDAINLIRHIEWQGDEIERLREDRDAIRDAVRVEVTMPTSTPAQTGVMASKTKKAMDEAVDAKALLADVRMALDIADSADPVAAIRSLHQSLRRAYNR